MTETEPIQKEGIHSKVFDAVRHIQLRACLELAIFWRVLGRDENPALFLADKLNLFYRRRDGVDARSGFTYAAQKAKRYGAPRLAHRFEAWGEIRDKNVQ